MAGMRSTVPRMPVQTAIEYWYYIDDGEPERADARFDNPTKNDYATDDEDGAVYVARIKVPSEKMGKVYFAFNEMGQMQTGLQYIAAENGFYCYFDDNGYPVDGNNRLKSVTMTATHSVLRQRMATMARVSRARRTTTCTSTVRDLRLTTTTNSM